MDYTDFVLSISDGTIRALNPHKNSWHVIKQHMITGVRGCRFKGNKEKPCKLATIILTTRLTFSPIATT